MTEGQDGSDLSSVNASRKTSQLSGANKATPGSNAFSCTPSLHTEQPLLPILEEEHLEGMQNMHVNALTPQLNRTAPVPESPTPRVHQSTLAVVEYEMIADLCL